MSSRDDAATTLIDLIRRVPILAIDVEAAKARGDEAQLEYAAAMTLWISRAAKAVSEIQQASPVREAPDPFARIAAASELLRQDQSDAA